MATKTIRPTAADRVIRWFEFEKAVQLVLTLALLTLKPHPDGMAVRLRGGLDERAGSSIRVRWYFRC